MFTKLQTLPLRVIYPMIGSIYGYIVGFFVSLIFFNIGANIIVFFVNPNLPTPLWVALTVKFLYGLGFFGSIVIGAWLGWRRGVAYESHASAQAQIQKRARIHLAMALILLLLFGVLLNMGAEL